MTGPIEMQSGFLRGPQATQNVAHQSAAQESFQQVTASEMQQKTKEATETTQQMQKSEDEGVKNATEQEGQNAGNSEKRKKKQPDKKEAENEDEFRGHFLDIRL